MNWSKAKTRPRNRAAQRTGGNPKIRQAAMTKYALDLGLACFVCKDTQPTEWAKTGISKRGPWAICLDCVQHQTSG